MFISLNEIPESLITKARLLADASAAEVFLGQYVGLDCSAYLKPFVEDVVFGNELAVNWMIGQVVVPDFSLTEQLCLEASVLLAPIGGAFDYRITPDFEDWQTSLQWVGAPALVLKSANYHYSIPFQAIGLGYVETEVVKNQVASYRRWIASRLARVVGYQSNINSIDQLIWQNSEIPIFEKWSHDAKRAGQALVREFKEFGQIQEQVPGMCGPDSWYED